MVEFLVLGIPLPSLPNPISGVTNAIGSGIAGFATQGIMGTLTQWVAGGAVWFLDRLGSAMSATSAPYLGSKWFLAHFHIVKELAILCILPVLLVSIIQAVARQDMSVLTRTFFVTLPLSIVASAVVVEGTQFALNLVDQMSKAVTQGSGSNISSFIRSLESWVNSPSPNLIGAAVPAFVGFLLACVVAFGALVLWVEMAIRSAAIYILVLFVPIAMIGAVNPLISHWTKRVFETLGALILSKLVVVATLALGVSAIAHPGANDPSGIIIGVAILLLGAFAPFAVLKLVPAVEAGAVAHLENMSRRGLASIGSAPRLAMQASRGAASTVGMVMNLKDSMSMSDLAGNFTGSPGDFTMSASRFSESNGPGGSSGPGSSKAANQSGGGSSSNSGYSGIPLANGNGRNPHVEKLLENWGSDDEN